MYKKCLWYCLFLLQASEPREVRTASVPVRRCDSSSKGVVRGSGLVDECSGEPSEVPPSAASSPGESLCSEPRDLEREESSEPWTPRWEVFDVGFPCHSVRVFLESPFFFLPSPAALAVRWRFLTVVCLIIAPVFSFNRFSSRFSWLHSLAVQRCGRGF